MAVETLIINELEDQYADTFSIAVEPSFVVKTVPAPCNEFDSGYLRGGVASTVDLFDTALVVTPRATFRRIPEPTVMAAPSQTPVEAEPATAEALPEPAVLNNEEKKTPAGREAHWPPVVDGLPPHWVFSPLGAGDEVDAATLVDELYTWFASALQANPAAVYSGIRSAFSVFEQAKDLGLPFNLHTIGQWAEVSGRRGSRNHSDPTRVGFLAAAFKLATMDSFDPPVAPEKPAAEAPKILRWRRLLSKVALTHVPVQEGGKA
jgi:hypothetical protein